MASSEVYETAEEDYKHQYADANRKLSELSRCRAGSEIQRKLTREINRHLEEANILIHKMEELVQRAHPSFRIAAVANIRTYKHDIQQLSNSLQSALSKQSTSRVTFGFAEEDEIERAEESTRTHLMHGTQSLMRASDSLARSHQIAAETDEIGNDIIDELSSQKESLLRTRDRLSETDENLSRSRKIMNRMSRSILTNKLLLVLIILVELGILGGVLYWKITSR